MATSRLRLRLAAGFALAFAGGLSVLAIGALGYLWRESNRRLDERLTAVNVGVAHALTREATATPDSSVAYAASEVVNEWPANGDAFVIIGANDSTLATVGPRTDALRVRAAWRASHAERIVLDSGGPDYRAVAKQFTIASDSLHSDPLTVIAFASTEGIESDTELLGVSLAIAAPLILLISLTAGYLMARGALGPVSQLTSDIASIAPTDLSRRLPMDTSRDEVSLLASEFNALLARLEDAQSRNRGFVREAAHQIRTPLTLVLGEAVHELSSAESSEDRMRATLERIRTAAEQMRRRVDELFLLAEARTGEPVQLHDDVELDGLLLECTDLMRGRATTLGRALAIGVAEPIVIRANAPLLQEAMLELMENACRHGTAEAPVSVSCALIGAKAAIDVTSGGREFDAASNGDAKASSGLGLAIVRWVAESHNGTFSVARVNENGRPLNRARLLLPVA